MTPEQKSWKSRLEACGVTQIVLANRCGLYPGEMCEYINCHREPRATRHALIENEIRKIEREFKKNNGI